MKTMTNYLYFPANEWFETRNKPNILELIEHNSGLVCSKKGPWIAGGIVLSAITGAYSKDIDVFFSSNDQWQLNVEQLEKKLGLFPHPQYSDIVEGYLRHDKGWCASAGLTTLSKAIQFIGFHTHANIEHLLNQFDISVAQCGFDGTNIIVNSESMFGILNKIAVVRADYKNPHYGPRLGKLCYRIDKYRGKGFTFDKAQVREVKDLAELWFSEYGSSPLSYPKEVYMDFNDKPTEEK